MTLVAFYLTMIGGFIGEIAVVNVGGSQGYIAT